MDTGGPFRDQLSQSLVESDDIRLKEGEYIFTVKDDFGDGFCCGALGDGKCRVRVGVREGRL